MGGGGLKAAFLKVVCLGKGSEESVWVRRGKLWDVPDGRERFSSLESFV